MTKAKNSIKNTFQNIKNCKLVRSINNILSNQWGIMIMGATTALFHILALELVLYILVAITTLYIAIFSDDFLPLMPIFVFCYISPTAKNNPALSTDSVFYNGSGICILIILIICIPALLIRIGLDKNMGYKKLFTQKRSLISGILILGIAYMISGIGSNSYGNIVLNNLLFSFLQFLSIFLLYFIFTATIDWSKTSKDYFAWLGIILGFVVTIELLNIYITSDVIQNGSIIRGKLYTGWGHYNNMGAIIAMSIPFAFYMCCKKKHNYIYLILGTLLLISLILSCSRGSIVGGLFIFAISFVYTFFKAEYKKNYRISSGVLVGVVIIFASIFHQELFTLFEKVPSILNTSGDSLSFNDSSRFVIYEEGFNAFLKYPIFGQSFYPTDFVPYDFSRLDSFSTLFPPRWHNTIIQILSSCGIVGMIAYSIHRLQTIKLFIKNRSFEKTFIGLSILVLLLTSLLDCHFFNIGPVLFYSMALAFAEKINDNDKQIANNNKSNN
ncbi:MAG: O-antigen ligase family protein [Clostridiales bacterium]|nr:O-antigen ligase family protein [Clostridiales bacterium]